MNWNTICVVFSNFNLFGQITDERFLVMSVLTSLDPFSAELTASNWHTLEEHLKDAGEYHSLPIFSTLQAISNTLFNVTQWLEFDTPYVDLRAQYLKYRENVKDKEWRCLMGDNYYRSGNKIWCKKCNVSMTDYTITIHQWKTTSRLLIWFLVIDGVSLTIGEWLSYNLSCFEQMF